VRAEIARIACRHYLLLPSAQDLITQLSHDNSDFVRQELVKSSSDLPNDIALTLLLEILHHESVDKVSACVIFELCRFDYSQPSQLFTVGDSIAELLNSNDSELLTRTVLDAIPRLAARLTEESDKSYLQRWYQRFEPKFDVGLRAHEKHYGYNAILSYANII